jgi:hypothetical protein
MAWYRNVSPQWRRRVLILVGLLVIYSLAGFLLVPWVLKSQLEKRLPGLTQRNATVRQVKFNPWALSLTIRGLELTEPDGRRFAGWEEFYVNFQLSSLFRWAWTFREIRLQEPFGEVVLDRDGRFNFANLFERKEAAPPASKPSGGMPRVRVFLLSVTNGFVAFEDRTRHRPFRTEYRPINLQLAGLSTQPGAATPYSFKAENDTGKRLSWAGDVTVNPPASWGSIEVVGADLAKYQPYLEDLTRAEILGGKADIQAAYGFSAGTNGIDLVVSNATVQVREVRVGDAEAKETVLAVPELSVSGGALNWRERRARVERVAISKPEVIARINPDGSVNLLRLRLPPPPEAGVTHPPASEEPWTVAVDEFQLEGAALAFDDLSRQTPFHTLLKPVDLEVRQFSNAPHSPAQYRFSIQTEAAEQITGAGVFSISPVQSSGQVQVAAVELKKYWPYLEGHLRGPIHEGKLGVEAAYQVQFGTDTLLAAVSNLNVRVTRLKVRAPDSEETWVEVPELAVEGASAEWGTRAARIKQLRVIRAAIAARRNADASINLLSLVSPAPPDRTNTLPAASEPTAIPAPPWTAVVEEVKLEDWKVAYEDRATPLPAAITLEPLTVEVKNVTTSSNEPVTVSAAIGVNRSGRIAVDGQVWPWRRQAGLQFGITNLALQPFEPYLREHVRLGIQSGECELHGRLDWQEAEPGAPRVTFRGGVQLTNLLAADLAGQEFVRWAQLQVTGIHSTLKPDSVRVAAVNWDGLKTSLRVGPEGQLNLLSVFPKSTPNAAGAEPPTAPAAPPEGGQARARFPIQLDAFILTNVSFHFADASIQPNCVFDVQELNGVIRGLSSDPAASAEVELSGRVDERAPFAVQGRLNPLSPTPMLNLSISNSGIQLPVFTPYMEKYGGYPINKGRLSLNLHYEIQDRALKAENKVQIDQLMLGARNNSPDASQLPIKLAVALLKDRNGLIELDVPVSGRLDDPQFRLGPIILKVLVNVITKAATSPFKLLGALVGGGEELSYVEFQPGSAAFLEGETNKLDKLVKALVERPALNLEIEALADPQADGQALARRAVRAQIKTKRLEEIASTGQPPPPAESFEVESDDYERLLRAALVEAFGTNLSTALHEFAAAAASPTNRPPPAKIEKPRQGWLQAAIGWLPIHGKNSPQAIARRRAKADAAILKRNPELAATAVETMEALLASRAEVPTEEYLRLMRERSQAVQQYLTASGEITAERLFLIAPKPVPPGQAGQARVTLSLN